MTLAVDQGIKPCDFDSTDCTGQRGQGGAVVTHLSPTSEVGGSNPGPYVGKLVVSYRWLAVTLTNCMYWFPLPIKLPIVI